MSTAKFIEAMPKADLHVHLEGAIQPSVLTLIAEHNEIPESVKHFDDWATLLNQPDPRRIHEIIETTSGWLKQSEDLTRAVYDVATTLAKQNIRYAEISVNPALYTNLNLTNEDFLAAINDGRDRADRAWGIRINWVFIVPREEPRRADDLARWVATAAARRGGVVALGVSGREQAQPIGQFERAFKMVEKKDIARVARIGEQGIESILKAVEMLNPNRLVDAWSIADSPEALAALAENDITVAVNLARAVGQGWIETAADYPLRQLYDEGMSLVLGSDMPALYNTSLTDEYRATVEELGFSQDDLEDLALNAVRRSFMDDDARAALLESFTNAYADLRAEAVETEETAP